MKTYLSGNWLSTNTGNRWDCCLSAQTLSSQTLLHVSKNNDIWTVRFLHINPNLRNDKKWLNKLKYTPMILPAAGRPGVNATPANLFASGMFQTGVFGGFQDLCSFVVSVPTCWVEIKKSAACIKFPIRTNMIATWYVLVLSWLCPCFNCKCAVRIQNDQLADGSLVLYCSLYRTCCDPTRKNSSGLEKSVIKYERRTGAAWSHAWSATQDCKIVETLRFAAQRRDERQQKSHGFGPWMHIWLGTSEDTSYWFLVLTGDCGFFDRRLMVVFGNIQPGECTSTCSTLTVTVGCISAPLLSTLCSVPSRDSVTNTFVSSLVPSCFSERCECVSDQGEVFFFKHGVLSEAGCCPVFNRWTRTIIPFSLEAADGKQTCRSSSGSKRGNKPQRVSRLMAGRKKKQRKRKVVELSCVSSRLQRALDLLVMTS